MSPNNPLHKEKKQSRLDLILRYALGYSLFFVILLLAAFLLFRIRMNMIQIGFLLGYNQVQVKGISNMGVLISGVLILAGVVFSEDYLRRGIEKMELGKRTLRLFLITGGLVLVSLALYYFLLLLAV